VNLVPPKRFSLAIQLSRLKERFPQGFGEIQKSHLIWNQEIRPHILAHDYSCRLEYSLGEHPKMLCMYPALSLLAKGRTLPHVYSSSEPVCLCLFMKRNECWNDSMMLADVVVPLSYYWLANFEDWLFSGEWRGGGTHPIGFSPPQTIPEFPPPRPLRYTH
jgi:hypothetical protein